MIGESLKQTLEILAAWEGMPLNYSLIGKQLGISCPAAKALIQRLVEARVIWLLYPLEATATSAAGKSRKSPSSI